MARDTLILDGARLGHIAARRGMLRGDVGRLAGVSSATQSSVFLGRPVSVSTARKIAEAVRVPIRKLIIDDTKTEAEMVKKTA